MNISKLSNLVGKIKINGGFSENIIDKFILLLSEPAHLKDAANGKYILSNESNLIIYNLKKIDDILGLSINDLHGFMHQCWGNDFAKKISCMDKQVKDTGQVVSDCNRIFIDANNFIRIQNMYKIPITNSYKKVIAVLTLSSDFTKDTNLFNLFDLYKKKHSSKNHAIEYFLKYIDIHKFLKQDLTEKETLCLLHMIIDNSYKFLAKKLDISSKTIEMHVSNVKTKIIATKNIHYVLNHLRERNYGDRTAN